METQSTLKLNTRTRDREFCTKFVSIFACVQQLSGGPANGSIYQKPGISWAPKPLAAGGPKI